MIGRSKLASQLMQAGVKGVNGGVHSERRCNSDATTVAMCVSRGTCVAPCGVWRLIVIPRAALWVIFTALGFVLCGPAPLISLERPSSAQATTAAAIPRSAGDAPPDEELDETVDFYGNRVIDAVAKYKLDGAGGVYELHSPQTEVPRPASPRG